MVDDTVAHVNDSARILIADDNDLVRELLVAHLRDLYDVTAVSGGREAVAIFSAEAFEIVVLDVDMPDLDGLEVLRAMREARPSLRAIVMSGEPEHRARALAAGVIAFVLKAPGRFTADVKRVLSAALGDGESGPTS